MIKSIEVTVTIVTDEHETHQLMLSQECGPNPETQVGALAHECYMRMLPDIPLEEEEHNETLGDA